MKSSPLKVVEIYPSNFRDPAATLRKIAEDIESGKHGEVGCIGIVLLGDELKVFGAGQDSEGPSVHYVLSCGVAMMQKSALDHGK